MEAVINIIFEVALRTLGLWVLKMLSFGRYRDTNSYLYYFPSFVGLLVLIFLIILLFLVISIVKAAL